MLTFILILIILLGLFFFIRQIKYKNYTTDLLHDKSREHFTGNKQKKNIKMDLPSNPNIIYCDYEGNTTIIKNSKVWKIDNKNNIFINNKNINEEYKLPYSINIKTGTLQDKYLIILTRENKLIEYDLIDKEIISESIFSNYFIDVGDTIDCMLYYNKKYYLFYKNEITVYDKDLDIIVDKYESTKIFNNIPKNISAAYLNNNILFKNKLHGTPCFYKNRDTYMFDIVKNKTYSIDSKYGFNHNTKYYIINFNKQKASFTPPKPGNYRIITIGAGNEGGGYGGLVYNDYELSKKDKLEIIVGQSGERLPLKDKIITHDKLPFIGSSAGSGGTFVYKKNKLLICSGGGGGWTSEIIRAPKICNSSFEKQKTNNKISIPIKKLVLVTKNTNFHKKNNIRQQIIVKDLSIDIFNYAQVDYDVETSPKSSIQKHKYETGYSDYNNICMVTIIFSKVISDYSFKIDALVKSTNNDNNYLDLYIYDEQGRKVVITDFNKNYNNVEINSRKIVSNFVKYPETLDNNEYVKSGNKSSENIDKLFDNPNLEDDDKDTPEYPLLKLNGGVGGGGNSISNKSKHTVCCGGGGGYIGGDHTSLNNDFIDESKKYINLDYIAGCGGLSYISNGKFDKDLFIDDYSNSNGKVIIIKIDDIQTLSEVDNTVDKYLEPNDKIIKPNKVLDMVNSKISKFNNKYDFKRPSINNDIMFNILNYQVFTINETLNSDITYFKIKINKKLFDRNKIYIKSDKNVDVMCLYFSVDNMNRILFKDENIKVDNILDLNHGMINPSLLNIFSFFENLLKYNIYKYTNSIDYKKLNKQNISNKDENITSLFDNKKFVYENINTLYLDNDIGKLKKVDYLYILIKNDTKKNDTKKNDTKKNDTKNKFKCNLVQYNIKNNTVSENDFKYQISNL